MKTEDKIATPDAGLHWDQAYQSGKQREEWTRPSKFVLSMIDQLDSNDVVLELGCGIGVDANYLASKVHSVTAVDHAQSLIESNNSHFKQPNLSFEVLDFSEGLKRFDSSSFTVAYARRSLHYFDDETTKRMFQEIQRVLKPGGHLFFECKSAKDLNAGQQAQTGDVRQFFGERELREYLTGFEIERSEEIPAEDFYGFPSVFLRCQARKMKTDSKDEI
jgi:ubiquinone/menaquinone biosynthesis C-methylase UbiE